MKLSVSLTNYSWADRLHDHLRSLAGLLDDTAVDTLWVPDHLLQADPASRLDEPMLEAYTALGYLAAATSRIRLGAMVTAATFRAPALLIKAVTTLDVLSAGRAWLGIGAGYNGDEARAMGLFLPGNAERFARMTELLRLARQMWNGDETPFHGEYLILEDPVGSPRPVTTPRPPVLIGGTGSGAHCGSSPSTAMRAICSTCLTAAPRSADSSTCWTVTVPTSAGRPRRSSAPSPPRCTTARTPGSWSSAVKAWAS